MNRYNGSRVYFAYDFYVVFSLVFKFRTYADKKQVVLVYYVIFVPFVTTSVPRVRPLCHNPPKSYKRKTVKQNQAVLTKAKLVFREYSGFALDLDFPVENCLLLRPLTGRNLEWTIWLKQNSYQKFFFGNYDDFGKKKRKYEIKAPFFWRTPIFENPCFGPPTLNIRHCSFVYKQRN